MDRQGYANLSEKCVIVTVSLDHVIIQDTFESTF